MERKKQAPQKRKKTQLTESNFASTEIKFKANRQNSAELEKKKAQYFPAQPIKAKHT